MSVKEYRPPIKGTCVCHWCGCTNYTDSLKQKRFFRIDGIMGDGCCWDMLKKFLMEIGVAEDKTMMKDIVKALKKAKELVALGALSDVISNNGRIVKRK